MSDVEDGVSKLPPEPECKGFLKPLPETTVLERVAAVVAGAAVLTAIVAMAIEQSAIVIVGGILSIIVGPYAYWQQTRLTDIKALQDTQKAVRAEVDKLSAENQRLERNVTDMTVSVQHLEDVQVALNVLTKAQGQSIDEFAKQVEENKKILAQMQSNLKANVLQNLLSVVLRSDADGDMILNESEVNELVRRIQSISGVKIYESRFRKALAGKSMQSVMNVMGNLLSDQVPDEERIFEFRSQ